MTHVHAHAHAYRGYDACMHVYAYRGYDGAAVIAQKDDERRAEHVGLAEGARSATESLVHCANHGRVPK